MFIGKRIYVGNLAYHTTVEDLQAAFVGAEVPTIKVSINQDRMSGQPQGFFRRGRR
jgi:cold-inducible RNA-binding protein